ncbi:hypothetical protein FA10DRAFT_264720 [Acaromyces ingoldii]|uniref:Transcription factor IIIC subunit 5 HTH domain-containing protein n=1 Tax=Acaromyces ingoldii TaxID=215250 RepID=A0A316YYL2_9BASI|nr:hypothetical protein FA10DRAFT_264720 [Acaromyces ingoldii]PWN94146.1 hypothetical protein FA10DRAFT_264720 [Acaromyces ingoldii]
MAIDEAGPSTQSGQSEQASQKKRFAPSALLPRAQYLAIEYPGVLKPRADEEDDTLVNALKTLAPGPPEFASPVAALKHLGRLVDTQKTLLECRLSSTASSEEAYRHALQGEVQPSHNVVLRVKKRTWKRKKSSGADDVCREYTVSASGVVRHVAKFKTMADFLYDPGLRLDSSSAGPEQGSTALKFLQDVCKMDANALLAFDLEGERADASRPIDMTPPPQFARRDAPLSYGFRQNPSSQLVGYGPVQSDGTQAMRFEHRLRDANVFPAQFSMVGRSARSKVPMDSKTANKGKGRALDEQLVAALKQRFEERPMWTRPGLLNQFSPADRRILFNHKQHIAECCYAITNGCWRDCLVKFAYDPRKDKESRFYQRMGFQAKTKRHAAPLGHGRKRASAEVEEDEGGSPHGAARADGPEEGDADARADSHIFDGVTPFPTLNSFMLIDITDEIARPYIDATGPQALRDKPDDVSGWYTAEQWEKIRTVLQLRFHFLANQGIPAPAEKCAAAVALVEARFRDTGSKGRQESHEADDDDDDMSEQSENVQ